ncbi:MAG: MATE family efflux transporter [Lachnospiraceae bacterium]|nr:MATE family efflux transporter [Lachnospiraceae bacterium]
MEVGMKKREKGFRADLISIALPVTLQSLLQSSFGMVDQIMIGQLGSESIAGIGLGGKFTSIYAVVLGAVAAAAGIMAAQYVGAKDERGMGRSFYLNLLVGLSLAGGFLAVCGFFPEAVMSLYTQDEAMRAQAVVYLRIYAISFPFTAMSTIMAVFLRCVGKAAVPLAASFFSVLLNTGLNYLLIFGRGGFPAMGVKGAAIASVIAQTVAFGVTAVYFCRDAVFRSYGRGEQVQAALRLTGEERKQYLGILMPILICEFLWSLGENMYAVIYGHLGTEPCAAMTMTGPVQGLMIGLLSGVSQATGIMIGRHLGKGDYGKAYRDSRKLMVCGFVGSVALSFLLLWLGRYYVLLYNVGAQVQSMAYLVLVAFAIISPVKVQNMILGGGIIRSGGMTRYVMWIDMIGTWVFGVPLGFLTAFAWKLPIHQVYFILSLEEVIRFLISVAVFRKKSWMRRL